MASKVDEVPEKTVEKKALTEQESQFERMIDNYSYYNEEIVNSLDNKITTHGAGGKI